MKAAYAELTAILPAAVRQQVGYELLEQAQEIRLRLGKPVTVQTRTGPRKLAHTTTAEDLVFCINAASRYSPWSAASLRDGYLTAPGGHRIGVCGEAVGETMENLTSLNIRVARDFPGIADGIPIRDSLLLLGPPGSGKTTLLRDLIRSISRQATVSVVDERGEIFPAGLDRGEATDVLTGQRKDRGIDMVLRSMGPEWIAVDEITNPADCAGLVQAGWCGVKLAATAHAGSVYDLTHRPVYRPLVETGLFSTAVVLRPDKSYTVERMSL